MDRETEGTTFEKSLHLPSSYFHYEHGLQERTTVLRHALNHRSLLPIRASTIQASNASKKKKSSVIANPLSMENRKGRKRIPRSSILALASVEASTGAAGSTAFPVPSSSALLLIPPPPFVYTFPFVSHPSVQLSKEVVSRFPSRVMPTREGTTTAK